MNSAAGDSSDDSSDPGCSATALQAVIAEPGVSLVYIWVWSEYDLTCLRGDTKKKMSLIALLRQEEAIHTGIWLSKRFIYFSWDRKYKHEATGNNSAFQSSISFFQFAFETPEAHTQNIFSLSTIRLATTRWVTCLKLLSFRGGDLGFIFNLRRDWQDKLFGIFRTRTRYNYTLFVF